MDLLKLVALDVEDLAILSAHLQDAVVRTEDMTFLSEQSRFVIAARRFEWGAPDNEARRRLTGVHFERVRQVRTRGLDRNRPEDVSNLLAITFEPGEAPSGLVTLVFAGDRAVQLEVECLEAQLQDLGPVWGALARPAHVLGPE